MKLLCAANCNGSVTQWKSNRIIKQSLKWTPQRYRDRAWPKNTWKRTG